MYSYFGLKLLCQFVNSKIAIALLVTWIKGVSLYYQICELSTKLATAQLTQSNSSFTNILFVTSNHQTTNLVFPNFFHEFFSVWAVEKYNKLFIGPKLRKKICLGPIKSLLSFSTAQLRKFHGKKWGKTRFVVLWFDITNWFEDY